jgi:Holliday junction resolvase-like predicted endonuclease
MSEKLTELRKKPHWSFSSINGFVNICSLQWAFQKIYKLESESSPIPLLFGTAFHKTAEWIATGRMKNITVKAEDAQAVFSEAWNWECRAADNLALSPEEWDQLNSTGKKMIDCLNREWTEKNILNVSKVFAVNLPGASKMFIGEIDLIVKDDSGDVVLVDWKTAAKKWPEGKAEKDLQATVFSYAWKQLTGIIPKFRYDVVTKTKEPAYVQYPTIRTDDDFLRLSHLVRTVEKAVAAEAFLPNEQGFYCKGCQFASACKTWHRKKARCISVPMKRAA